MSIHPASSYPDFLFISLISLRDVDFRLLQLFTSAECPEVLPITNQRNKTLSIDRKMQLWGTVTDASASF